MRIDTAPLHAALARGELAALEVSGELRRSPLAGELYKAELGHVPMTAAHEYESVVLFEQPSPAPVLLSPGQRVRLLGAATSAARRHVGDLGVMCVRLYGPDFNVPLSAELLAEDVIIAHDPLRLVPAIRERGLHNILVIDQDLRADGLEQGRNTLALWLIDPTRAGLDGFAHLLAEPGPWDVLEEATIRAVDARRLATLCPTPNRADQLELA
jgi:hypothetical protein